MEYLLLFIGLGFFMVILKVVLAADERFNEREDRLYQRRLNEQREFGVHEKTRRFHKT